MSKLSETAQIRQFIAKDQHNLSETQYEILNSLEELNKEAPNIAKRLEDNLRNFQATASEIFASHIPEDLANRKEELLHIFNQTLIERAASAADDIAEALQKKENLLFNGLLASYAVKILEGILDFEKKIDSVFPGASQKIIKAASNAITALIAAHFPAIAMVIKASGIMEKAEKFLAVDNLEKTVKDLKSKIAAIEQDQKLENSYKSGVEIAQIAEKTSIPVHSIANLGLEAKSLQTINNNLKTEPNSVAFLQEVSKAEALMPTNEKELTNKLQTIKENIHSSINNGGLSTEARTKITHQIDNYLQEAKENFKKLLKSTLTFFEKVELQQKTASMLVKVTKSALSEFNKEANKTKINEVIIEKVAKIVSETLQRQVPELMKQAAKSPSTARELGLNNAIKASLDKHTTQQRETTQRSSSRF